jgi:hypothetical protein
MSGPEAPPALAILPRDLEVIMKLLPRAQIVVGDIPQIYASLQRLEAAARSGHVFLEAQAQEVESERGA